MKTLLLILLSTLSLAAFAAPTSTTYTPEQRKQMANMHLKAAECLNSTKTVQECHQEMMKNCPMMKDGSCPMMGMGMGAPQEPVKSKTTK
ncbi:hypothetical protein [Bdellovibrio sp. HCB337]|uniref:hypothetical protein n=1 Tax=Bdellovibrio sp. HCB337 TaxID=3394358 RepID=UPI0039A50412